MANKTPDFEVKHDPEILQDHPDFEQFNRLVSDMCQQQVIDGVVFDDQALSATLMMILCRNHSTLVGDGKYTLTAVIAQMVERDMSKDMKQLIKLASDKKAH